MDEAYASDGGDGDGERMMIMMMMLLMTIIISIIEIQAYDYDDDTEDDTILTILLIIIAIILLVLALALALVLVLVLLFRPSRLSFWVFLYSFWFSVCVVLCSFGFSFCVVRAEKDKQFKNLFGSETDPPIKACIGSAQGSALWFSSDGSERHSVCISLHLLQSFMRSNPVRRCSP